jgi:hypothetical protein
MDANKEGTKMQEYTCGLTGKKAQGNEVERYEVQIALSPTLKAHVRLFQRAEMDGKPVGGFRNLILGPEAEAMIKQALEAALAKK